MANPKPTHNLFSNSGLKEPKGGSSAINNVEMRTVNVEARAVIVNGTLIPDADGIREMVASLRADLATNSALKSRFNEDPRGVMAERGFARDLQTEIILEGAAAECGFTCASTSSCCCETL
jgi:hypothetical protein